MSNMKYLVRFAVAMTLCLGSIVAIAHHSARGFDENRHIELEGRIIEIDYRNPHIEMIIHVGVDDPTTTEVEGQIWEVETVSATTAHRHGIYAESLAVGNPLRIRGWAARDGDTEIFVSSITLFDEPETVLLLWQEGTEAGSLASDDATTSQEVVGTVETQTPALDSSALLKVKTFVLRDRL